MGTTTTGSLARPTEVAGRAREALAAAWRQARPGRAVDQQGYVDCFQDNLVPGVAPASFEDDLGHGSGHELLQKFRASYSSSALAVNTFARWKPTTELAQLGFAGQYGYEAMRFERGCSTGLRGGPATLDVVLEAGHHVVGIESKLLEPLSPKAAKFSDAYDTLAEPYGGANWRKVIDEVRAQPERVWHLDVAQLVKHALGLSHTYAGQWLTLVYLYWQPLNAHEFSVYQTLAAEIEELTAMVAGDNVRLQALTYPDLWADWAGRTRPPWLPAHLGHLMDRYAVAI